MKVVEHERVIKYLDSRGLNDQYRKVKQLISGGLFRSVKLKKRKPTSANIWYFRINRQYRAFCTKKDDVLIVFEIDDHQ
ncbi:hypothetical protein HOF56_00280 [Candidatus Peribacteria bacterium]|jgi:hypothetical protein|nr:hypothetical protein [Candidatus Peribacteria bacterium]MBT4021572.1 hypothetical protein [Candidatus Peribacteria bacterium]MBT4240732.1 hypothetical protein [Candidatus Peribacteria bacterium]MBT4474286.1 hypothetical protein [Candidatus Peribacteria bacterium]